MASFDEAVPPGQEGHLDVKIHTANLRGTVRKTVRLTTNDPHRPDRVLRIVVRVVGSVDVLPRGRVLLSERGSTPLEGEIVLRKDATETGTLAVSDVSASAAWLEVGARKIAEAGAVAAGNVRTVPGDWVLTVRADADLRPGNHQGTVTFRTGLERESQVTVPVTAVIRAALHVSAKQVLLHRPVPGSDTRGAFLVSLKSGLDPQELVLTVEPEQLQLVTEPSGPHGVRVYVVLADRGEDTPNGGVVDIRHGENTARVDVRVIPRNSAAIRPPANPRSGK